MGHTGVVWVRAYGVGLGGVGYARVGWVIQGWGGSCSKTT